MYVQSNIQTDYVEQNKTNT